MNTDYSTVVVSTGTWLRDMSVPPPQPVNVPGLSESCVSRQT